MLSETEAPSTFSSWCVSVIVLDLPTLYEPPPGVLDALAFETHDDVAFTVATSPQIMMPTAVLQPPGVAAELLP